MTTALATVSSFATATLSKALQAYCTTMYQQGFCPKPTISANGARIQLYPVTDDDGVIGYETEIGINGSAVTITQYEGHADSTRELPVRFVQKFEVDKNDDLAVHLIGTFISKHPKTALTLSNSIEGENINIAAYKAVARFVRDCADLAQASRTVTAFSHATMKGLNARQEINALAENLFDPLQNIFRILQRNGINCDLNSSDELARSARERNVFEVHYDEALVLAGRKDGFFNQCVSYYAAQGELKRLEFKMKPVSMTHLLQSIAHSVAYKMEGDMEGLARIQEDMAPHLQDIHAYMFPHHRPSTAPTAKSGGWLKRLIG